jgi:hypothetical protein
MCHKTKDWYSILPTILLGLRTTYKEDLKSTAAEMVYGTTISLPGQFFVECDNQVIQSDFVKSLKKHMSSLRPVPASNHAKEKIFIDPDLKTCSHVFIRNDTVRPSLTPPYDGPYQIIKRNEKNFILKVNNKIVNVSIDRLKAAHITDEPVGLTESATSNSSDDQQTTKPTDVPSAPKIKKKVTFNPKVFTRSGREIQPPRYQCFK